MVNQFQRLAWLQCCVYLKIIRAKEAANDDGGLHIGGQIRQWTTITDQRGTMVRGLIFCRQRVYFYLFFCTCICNCIGFGICFCICIWICVLTRVRCMMMVRGPWSLCFQRTGLRPLAAWHTNCTLGIRVAFRLDMALLVNQFGSATLFDLIWLFDMLDMTCDFWLLIFYFLICFSTWYDSFANSVQSGFFAADLKLFLSWEFQTEKVFASVYLYRVFFLTGTPLKS